MPLSLPGHPEHTRSRLDPVVKTVNPAALAQAETIFLLVQGIGCPICALRVHHSLMRLDGVLAVEIALAPCLARVRYDPNRVDPDGLPEAVRAASAGPHCFSAQILT